MIFISLTGMADSLRSRQTVEASILSEVIAELEQRAYSVPTLISLAASFDLTNGRRIGAHLNAANVVCHIEPGSQAEEEGTLRMGDKVVAVNTTPAEGADVAEIIRGLDRVLFIVARQVSVLAQGEEEEEEEEEPLPPPPLSDASTAARSEDAPGVNLARCRLSRSSGSVVFTCLLPLLPPWAAARARSVYAQSEAYQRRRRDAAFIAARCRSGSG